MIALGFAFIGGWAACLAFQFLWAVLMDFAEGRFIADDPFANRESHVCPWPLDDEAERGARLAEYQRSHSTHVASGAQPDHG